MGRRKISIAPIVDDRNRSVTFLKRKNGLFKKAFELGILCSAEVAVIVFSNTGKLFEFSSTDMDTLLLRYSHFSGPQHEKRGPEDFMSKDVDAIRKKGLGGKMTSLSDREGGNDSNDEENEEGDEDEVDEDEGEQLIGNWGIGVGVGDGSSDDDDEVTKPKKNGKRGKAPPKKSAKKSKGGNNKMTDSSANNSPPHSHNAGPSPPLSVHSLPLPTHHFPPGISPFYQSQPQPSVNPYYSSIPPNGSTSNGSGGSNTPGATFSPSWNGYSSASLGGGTTSNGVRPHPLAGMNQPSTLHPQQAQLHPQQQQHPAGQWVLAPHSNNQPTQPQQQQHSQPHWTQGPSSTTSSSSNSIKASSNLATSSSAPNTSSAYGVSSIPAGAELAALHAAYQQSQLVPGQNQALGPTYYAGYQQQQQQQAAAHVAAQQHLQAQQQQQQLHHQQQQQQQQAHQQQQQAQAQHQAQQQAQHQHHQQQQQQQHNQLQQQQQLQSQAHQHQLQQQQQQQQQQFLQHQAQLHHHQQQRELQRRLSGSELGGRPESITSLRSDNGTLSRTNSNLQKPRLSVSIPGTGNASVTGDTNEEEDVKLLMTEEPDRMDEGDDVDEEELDHSLDPGFTPSTNSRYAADLLPSPSGFLNDHLYSGYSLSGLNTAIAMSNEETRGSIFSWPTKSDRTTVSSSSQVVGNKVGESIVEESPISAGSGIIETGSAGGGGEGGEGSSTPSGPAPALNERDAPDLYGSNGPGDENQDQDQDQEEQVEEEEEEEVIPHSGGRDTRFSQLKKRGNEELPRSPVTATALEERGSDEQEGEDEYIKKSRTRLT